MKYSPKLIGHMNRWAMRSSPSCTDDRVICVHCKHNTWYSGDSVDATFQVNGQYLCKECRVINPIQTALCESIPYEVLSIFMSNFKSIKVKEYLWK